jgi:hypothetical protein
VLTSVRQDFDFVKMRHYFQLGMIDSTGCNPLDYDENLIFPVPEMNIYSEALFSYFCLWIRFFSAEK